MGRIITVDYNNLSKNVVGRPKLKEQKHIKTVRAEIRSKYTNNYSKIKFRIKDNIPMVYFTNRETTNLIPEDQYISNIQDNLFLIPDCGLKGKYFIEPIGYHWYKLVKTDNDDDNIIII